MKYFLDTEFKEGFHKPLFGKNRHYIDLISIGIIGEDNSEYYAISNEFDLKAIWNDKDTWVKDNVLKSIHKQLCAKQSIHAKTYHPHLFVPFTLKSMRNLIKWHGKSNQRIVGEIIMFIYRDAWDEWMDGVDEFVDRGIRFGWNTDKPIEFYAYYADYDWVLFCSLFGRMLNLPENFPMYCIDLMQMVRAMCEVKRNGGTNRYKSPLETYIKTFKKAPGYPKQKNEHNALDDAKWNKELYTYIQNP